MRGKEVREKGLGVREEEERTGGKRGEGRGSGH